MNSATSLGNSVHQEAGLAGSSGTGNLFLGFWEWSTNGELCSRPAMARRSGSFTAVAVAPDNSAYFGSCVAPLYCPL